MNQEFIYKAQKMLKQFYGYDTFREGQEEIIQTILSGTDSLVIMPTGGGKSICFQIPALIFEGITLVISPLISLMKDQVDGLVDMGIPATLINSTVDAREMDRRMHDILDGKYKLVYVAPERLDTYQMEQIIKGCKVSLIAVDEAHCVSQWGHDFRSSYLTIHEFIRRIPLRPVVAAFTATATPHVMQDIVTQIKLQTPRIFQQGYDRTNLKFFVLKGVKKKQFVLEYVSKNKSESGIIYCSTRKETEKVCEMLKKKGVATSVYHAGLTINQRKEQQEQFIYEKTNVVVATNAFGMGIDKSNVRYVIHYNMPENIEAYYQEAGRAGRDGETSECILLFSPGDVQIRRFLIDQLEERDPNYLSHRYEKLQQMTHYCHINTCHRKHILNYFGETAPDYCGQCSNCSDEIIKEDVTIEAMKVLSCVVRMKERFGIATVSEVLKGSKNKKITQYRFEELSTYGLMNKWTLVGIKDFISSLVADGYLEQSTDEFPIIRLTPEGRAVLKKEISVIHNQMKAREVVVNDTLFDQLRELRRGLALQAGVPPYAIFSDKSLREMAGHLPTDQAGMLNINGVGSVKYQKYGELFIESIKKYMTEKGLEIPQIQPMGLDDIVDENDIVEAAVKKAVKKKTKTPTCIVSAELFENLGSIEMVARQRDIKLRTVEDHIFQAYEFGYAVDISCLIPEGWADMIKEAIRKVGTEKLTPIKELCPEAVTFTAIKAVIAVEAKGK